MPEVTLKPSDIISPHEHDMPIAMNSEGEFGCFVDSGKFCGSNVMDIPGC